MSETKHDSQKVVIITGGAGYLGRCVAEVVHREGYTPVIVDNFSNSREPRDCAFAVHRLELCDLDATREVWRKYRVHGVIHFAARALVSESVAHPELYFRNNLMATLSVAQASLETGVRFVVHSSSCAVYGVPTEVPIPESHPQAPITPYGESKRMAEWMLLNYVRHKNLRMMNLRYFNPAGSLDDGRLGEAHEPETHLVPNVVRNALDGKAISIFGDDYPTPDGTCIRDFIHVEDLATAHVAALRYLENPANPQLDAVNVGVGRGVSVKEIIAAAERVFERKLETKIFPRRPGDPPMLVAEASLVRRALGWAPKRSVEDMLRSHLAFEKRRRG